MLAVRAADVYHRLHESATPYEQCPYDSHNGRLWHFLGETALALYGEVAEAETWLDYALTMLWGWYPIWGDEDGGWAEGLHYYTSYNEYFLTWLQHARGVLRLPLERKPFFAHAGDFPLYVAPPGAVMAGFGDFSEATPPVARGSVAGGYAAIMHHAHWQWLADGVGTGSKFLPLHFLFAISEKPPAAPLTVEPRLRVFRGVGWAVFNADLTSPTANVQFLLRASPFGNQSHSHGDQNGVVLGAFGVPLLVNTGFRDYDGSRFCKERYWHTRAHNSLLLDWEGQERGLATTCTLVRWGENGPLAWAVGDATNAYGGRAQSYRRYAAVWRIDPECYVVALLDDVKTTASRAEILYHARQPLKVDEVHKRFILSATSATLAAHVFANAPVGFELSDHYSVPYEVPGDRLEALPREWHLSVIVRNERENERQIRAITAIVVSRHPHSVSRLQGWRANLRSTIPTLTWDEVQNRRVVRRQIHFNTNTSIVTGTR